MFEWLNFEHASFARANRARKIGPNDNFYFFRTGSHFTKVTIFEKMSQNVTMRVQVFLYPVLFDFQMVKIWKINVRSCESASKNQPERPGLAFLNRRELHKNYDLRKNVANRKNRICFYHMIWFIWYHMISYDVIWYHMISYDIIWYRMISYDIIWYHMISDDIIRYHMIS